ncbi:STAS domain-containing protein [Streptomyces sp. NPDC058623]|uniref:STAS domain-containing protein n=1 Tax=Streptomyces sp. NPDC058623 TaxID=3346563 RepID=UPI003664FBD7
MSDAEVAKTISTRIAAYLTTIHPHAPDPDDLAQVIVRALRHAGILADPKPRAAEKAPGDQQVLVLADQDDGVRVIVCAGEFDQHTLGPVHQAGTAAIADPAIRRIVLDAGDITFADSSMLNELFRLRRGTDLVLVGPLPRSLERVLELTQARLLFHVVPSIEAARTIGPR